MIPPTLRLLLATTLLVLKAAAGELLFQDDFQGRLGDGWKWLREHRDAWRTNQRGLEVRIEPGNMWGPQNDAKNLLYRPAPDPSQGGLEVDVSVENAPSNQYEQVDLAWYYNDSNMVKLGLELVDGKLCVVMGREEGDRTRTLSITPVDAHLLHFRVFVAGDKIRGQFRTPNDAAWRNAGECTLPAPEGVKPSISLQFYQGAPEVEHWGRVTGFRVLRASGP